MAKVMQSVPGEAQNAARVVPLRVFETKHGGDFIAFSSTNF
jgi:hypothetical protein